MQHSNASKYIYFIYKLSNCLYSTGGGITPYSSIIYNSICMITPDWVYFFIQNIWRKL